LLGNKINTPHVNNVNNVNNATSKIRKWNPDKCNVFLEQFDAVFIEDACNMLDNINEVNSKSCIDNCVGFICDKMLSAAESTFGKTSIKTNLKRNSKPCTSPITEQEILTIVKRLKNSKASGLDDVCNE
jgi:hypothetical protein